MRKAISIIVIILAAILIIGYLWQPMADPSLLKDQKPSQAEEAQDIEQARAFLREDKPDQALKIVQKYSAYISPSTESGKKWLEVLIQANENKGDARQLRTLYEFFPDQFAKREKSSLLVAQSFLSEDKVDDFNQVRSQWNGTETQQREWILLDADKFILEGNKNKAVSLLKSHQFKKEDDVGRLVRLSMLTVDANPKEAWGYLKEAVEKDPQNPTVRLYRGKLLEASGNDALALSEFVAAVQAQPESLSLRNQLADYFIRYQQYPQAVDVLDNTVNEGLANNSMLLKTWFWEKVAFPGSVEWNQVKVSDGVLQPYLDYLVQLGNDQFWDAKAFNDLKNRNQIITNQQSTFWLRLAQSLKTGNEDEALQLLKNNRFKEKSWHPELETALQRILTYRKDKTLSIEEPLAIHSDFNEEEIQEFPFFRQLEKLADEEEAASETVEIPAALDELLKSNDAFAAAYLAGGWNETALDLQTMSVIPETFPSWVAYGFTEALKANRGPVQALKFATVQTPSPELTLLTGQLLLDTGSSKAALDTLTPLSKIDSPLGQKALAIVAAIYINKKDYEKAQNTVYSSDELANSLKGQEILARIALLEGQTAKAEKIYQSILEDSSEAKSYFARKAYAEKNYPKARKLTEELLREYPNNVTIRTNLQRIIKEQNKPR